MRLVDHGAVPRCARMAVTVPVVAVVDDDGLRHRSRAVRRVGLEVLAAAEAVAEDLLSESHLPLDGARIRIEEELRGLAAQPARRVVLAVDAVAVPLPGPDRGEVAVPAVGRHLGKIDA